MSATAVDNPNTAIGKARRNRAGPATPTQRIEATSHGMT